MHPPCEHWRSFLALGFAALLSGGCGEVEDDRTSAILGAMTRVDETLIRARPALVHGKYARMAGSLYAFYRGGVPIFAADLDDGTFDVSRTRFPAPGPLPLGTGDQHPENFGILRAADGSFALEPNDFDGADRYPYWVDLRRLTIGLVLLARLSNADDVEARDRAAAAAPEIVRSAVEGYADGIAAFAAGAPRERWDDDRGVLGLTDLFRRAERDEAARRELDEMTEIVDGRRRLLRGRPDPEDPEEALHDLPAFAREGIQSLVDDARETLIDPPEAAYFTVQDAARHVGVGVASWPRVRILVLVRGPTDDPGDDELLEIKEVPDSGAEGWLPPGRFADDVPSRIVQTTRAGWARPDAEPLFGAASWLGAHWHMRREASSHKTLRVHRQEGARGRPEALIALARELGRLLARIHASPVPGAEGAPAAIAAAIAADPPGFVDDEVAVALDYADTVESDWQRFRDAFQRRGPRLGLPLDPRDRPRAELAALFGEGEPVASAP